MDYKQKYEKLLAEIRKRNSLISAEKEKATSQADKLSLGGRVAILQELLASVNKSIPEYSVFVKGERVNICYLTEERAERIAELYREEGCDDVVVKHEKSIHDNDLFFADNEELTEFQNKLFSVISEIWQNYLLGREIDIAETVKEYSPELLDLARKELQPEMDNELEKAYKTQDDVVYRNGYAQGKQDALKAALESLPKWKKGTPPSATTLYVIRKGYYMTIEEVDELFEILPKEE